MDLEFEVKAGTWLLVVEKWTVVQALLEAGILKDPWFEGLIIITGLGMLFIAHLHVGGPGPLWPGNFLDLHLQPEATGSSRG